MAEGCSRPGAKLNSASNTDVTENITRGNTGPGLILDGTGAFRNNVRGNTVTNNTSHGVEITNGANQNNIGGQLAGQGNTISGNGGAGILLTPTAGQGNNLDPNSIFGNVGHGIDIGGDGFTWNDEGDADGGPNNRQNYPEIVSKQIINDELVIGFKIPSAPENSSYGASGIYVEFFEADAASEGERFLGSTFYTRAYYNSGSPGLKTVNLGNVLTLDIDADDPITATATDAAGNTSEFYPVLVPTAAGVAVAGRVFDGRSGIPRAAVSLNGPEGFRLRAITNPFGFFRFEGVPAGQTYWIDVTERRFLFDTRVIAVHEDIVDLVIMPAETP